MMKRPLATVGMCFLLSLAALSFLPANSTKFVIIPLFAAAIYLLVTRRVMEFKVQYRVILCTFLAAAVCFAACEMRQNAVAARYGGQEWDAVVRVTNCTKYDDSYYSRADVLSLGGEATHGLDVTFYSDAPYEIGGDYALRLRLADASRASIGTTVTVRASVLMGGKIGDSWRSYVHRFGEAVRRNIRRYLGGAEGELICSMLTGDRSALPASVDVALKRSGMSHILAISGLHVSLMLAMVAGLFGRMKHKAAARFTAITMLGLLLLVLYDARPSVVRAVVMNWTVLCAAVIGRESDSVTSLGAAALLILLQNPRSAGDLSFILSFASCFALCVVAPYVTARIEQKRGKPLRGIFRALISSVTVTVVTFPVLVLYGLPVSLVAPFANLVLLSLVTPMLALGIVIGLLGAIGWLEVLFRIAAFGAGVCAKIVVAGAKLFGGFTFSVIQLSDDFVRIWLIGVGIVAAILFLRRKKARARTALVGLCVTLALVAGIASKAVFAGGKGRVYQYENTAVVCVSRGETAIILREKLNEADMEYLRYWCDTRFLPAADYVILLSDDVRVVTFGDAQVSVNGGGSVDIRLNGAQFEAVFGNGWTLDIVNTQGESIRDFAHSLFFVQEERYATRVIYVAADGSYKAVRET